MTCPDIIFNMMNSWQFAFMSAMALIGSMLVGGLAGLCAMKVAGYLWRALSAALAKMAQTK